MAIAVVDTSSGRAQDNTSVTFAHIGTGVNTVLIVLTNVFDAENLGAVSGVTYAGAALTKILDIESGTGERSEIWYKVAPATGTNNVIVSTTNQVNVLSCGAITFSGAKQTGVPDAQ